jgi:predicted XRE-type DNA-binding protein
MRYSAGAVELRVHARGEWRVIYLALFADAVYVRHCFEKRSREIARSGPCAPALQVDWMNKTIKSRGNVFVDLGFAPEEAAVLKMRADLMGDLREFIRDSRLTQARAAKRLGITQSRVSDLVRGRWEKFNLEMLIKLTARAGRKVQVRVVA